MKETEFVTHKQWQSYALRIEKANLRDHGTSLSFSYFAKKARNHIIEIQDDRKGMIVTKGWQKTMKEESIKTY